MVDEAVMQRIRCYVSAASALGVPISRVVLYGSQARGTSDKWSDIDLIVVSPVFDGPDARDKVDLLWQATTATNGYIEPVACGERRWQEDDGSPIIEIARREGIEIFPDT
jgi:predicted nucleotidyltransferase